MNTAADNPLPTEDRRASPRDDPVRSAHHDAVYTLARASEIHDEETGNHVLRIRSVARVLALAIGFDPEDADSLGYDAMLHDVGKLLVPREILQKPSRLNDVERAIMRSHTVQGERLLQDRPTMVRAAAIARSHHERFDGTGYPDGLLGTAIPLPARITAAADVLDVLMSRRAYKEAWSYDDAMNEVVHGTEGQLDPEIARALGRAQDEPDLHDLYA